jgi:aconitase A
MIGFARIGRLNASQVLASPEVVQANALSITGG